MKRIAIQEKSFSFALRIIKCDKFLRNEFKEYAISNQVLRSGTAVGALVREAEHAESKPDFTHKMNIALKEANQTVYWLELLYHSEYLSAESFNSIHADAIELVKLLMSIVKTSRKSN